MGGMRQANITGSRRRGALSSTLAAAVAVVAAAAGVMVAVPTAQAQAAPNTSTLDGSTAGNAAASCHEVKTVHPSSSDGTYWLRTDVMERPEQFYCDMTTDGGGWVLIGRGREGWTFRDYGQSTPQNLRETVTGPSAFGPAALSTDTINALIGGGNVFELTDGLRVRRATAITPGPTDWQELRWEFDDLTTWSWAFGGAHRLSSFEVDGVSGVGANTRDSSAFYPGQSGNDAASLPGDEQWFTYGWSAHGGLSGFAYNGDVDGQNNATSYLWELNNENHAIPFAQLFLRPELTTPTLAPIPDTGTAELTLSPLVSDHAEEIAGGVTGVRKVGDSEPALDTPVLAITTHGDRVYVGGKFDDVRDTVSGQLVDQNYLAAFDRSTGAWIPSFAPQLDGTVFDLEVVDGKLIVAGQFTNVDGETLTAGLAALDLTTGAVVPGWRSSMELSGSSDRPLARAIDVEGDWIYVGGNFTRITSLVGPRNEARLGRVRVSDGHADNVFVPDVNGVPYDIDVANGRVYVVGDFEGVNGNTDRGVSVVDADDGTVVPGLFPAEYTTSNPSRQYQQAVLAVGSDVYQGGSEHNVHVYADADYSLTRSHVTSGRGGDTQAYAEIDGVVYQGSHGNFWIYQDATTWPGLEGYTRVDDYKWVGAFDTATASYDPTWAPSLDTFFNEGVWELHADADDCLWFGGDINGGPFVNGQRQYLEGFSKFCQRDTTAPTVPANAIASPLTAGGVQVDWSNSTDDFPGFIGYEVLRNDRPISPLVYGTSFVDPVGNEADRYFVRAVDPAGNRSASTGVLVPSDNIDPTIPTDLAFVLNPDDSVDLTWTASTDDVGVVDYRVLRNGVEIALVAPAEPTVATVLTDLGPGSHWLQVQALDAAGNESFKTPPVRVDIEGPDTQRPTQPGNPQGTVAGDIITMTWTASSDNVAVTGYTLRRNLVEVASTDAATLTADLDLGSGTHYIQIEAFDAAGNVSYRTAPVVIEIVGPDVTSPSTPTDLVGTVLADDTIDISWTASTDDVGVTGYEIRRNGAVVETVDGVTTAANLDLGLGTHYIQVRAVDAAGNESFNTAPIVVEVVGPDTERPSTPTGLTAVAEPDGTVTVSWNASTDNVGVVSYRVLRNLNEVIVVDATTLTANVDLGSGTHYVQVQALDAAGNESFRTAPQVVTI